MPYGKTLEMISETHKQLWRPKNANLEPVKRDRSLRGKARRRARKEANKASWVDITEAVENE